MNNADLLRRLYNGGPLFDTEDGHLTIKAAQTIEKLEADIARFEMYRREAIAAIKFSLEFWEAGVSES